MPKRSVAARLQLGRLGDVGRLQAHHHAPLVVAKVAHLLRLVNPRIPGMHVVDARVDTSSRLTREPDL
jgi:hypothetical protein